MIAANSKGGSMSRKNYAQHQLCSAKSLAASFSTASTILKGLDNVGYTIATDNVVTNSGKFQVMARIGDGDWQELTFSSSMTLANADDSWILNLNQVPFTEIRIDYAPGAPGDDGDVDIWLSAKEI
jgi:hypothetical protein